MITLRPASERGHFEHGWLDTYHTFSFGEYYDPRHNHFRSLRVLNEDVVAPGSGFPTHAHRDMEIMTVVLSGALQHRDSMGNTSVIRPGDVQIMSAGSGLTHSEFNPSDSEPVHLLQIWLFPEKKGLTPRYDQKAVADEDRRGRLKLVAAGNSNNGALKIHQDVRVYSALLAPGDGVEHTFEAERHGWLQVIRGAINVNGTALSAGDGAAISDERTIVIEAEQDAEFLLFDLA